MPLSKTPRVAAHLPIFSLLLAFTALAVAYSIVVPLFEGPDEDDHFRYVKYLADHRALPVQLFQPGGGAAGHQGWQPPLYYAIAALVIAPIDTSDFEQHLWRNPAASYQGDRACCGRNLYFHARAEDFPHTRTTLAVHLARGVSILFGAITVACIYALTLTLFPKQKWLALAAATIAGFNPSFLFASALVSNDASLAALCSLALLLCAKLLLNQIAPNLKNFALLGLVIALAILAKSTALGLIPFALAVGAFLVWQKHNARIFLNALVGITMPCAILTGWWFVRNQILYGDPMAYRLIYASAIFPREQPLTWPELFQINLPWLWQTFWGGPTPGDFPPALLIVLCLLAAFAAIGALIFFIRQRELSVRAMLLLLAIWLAFIFIAQLQFIRTSGGTDQGRYLFPAIAPFAILFAMGARELTVRVIRAQRAVSLLVIASIFTLACYVLLANTLPAYARPSQTGANILTRAEQQLDANFSNQLALRGYTISPRRLKRGAILKVDLYWQSLAAMRESYRVFAHLVNQDGRVAGGKDVIPYGGAYATVLWQPGEYIPDTITFAVSRDAIPGTYQLEVGLYPVGQPDNRLNLARSEEDRVLLDAIQIEP